MYNIRLVWGLFVFRSIPCPSPAILCVEGLTPLSCISSGSRVNRLLAGEKLRGQKKGRRQGISPLPLYSRDILGQQLHLLHGTSSCWTDPPGFLLPSGVPSLWAPSSFCLSILWVTVASHRCCSLAYLPLPCLGLSSSSHLYNQFPKLISLL